MPEGGIFRSLTADTLAITSSPRPIRIVVCCGFVPHRSAPGIASTIRHDVHAPLTREIQDSIPGRIPKQILTDRTGASSHRHRLRAQLTELQCATDGLLIRHTFSAKAAMSEARNSGIDSWPSSKKNATERWLDLRRDTPSPTLIKGQPCVPKQIGTHTIILLLNIPFME